MGGFFLHLKLVDILVWKFTRAFVGSAWIAHGGWIILKIFFFITKNGHFWSTFIQKGAKTGQPNYKIDLKGCFSLYKIWSVFLFENKHFCKIDFKSPNQKSCLAQEKLLYCHEIFFFSFFKTYLLNECKILMLGWKIKVLQTFYL